MADSLNIATSAAYIRGPAGPVFDQYSRMATLTPVYTSSNCRAAYQLNWSVTAFPKSTLPDRCEWLSDLKSATEPDGVRVLECHAEDRCVQFFVSSRPDRSLSAIVASVKGRLQYFVRDQFPRAFRRNYRIESVGSAKAETLDSYVGNQTTRHAMADPRLQH
jgi:REP element-mobilizing transposase RayT